MHVLHTLFWFYKINIMFLKIAILTKPIWAVLSVWNIRWVQRQDYRMFGVDCLCKWAFPFVSCDPIDNITLSDIPAYHLSQGNSRFFSLYEWWAPYFTSYDHVRWDPIKLPYAWQEPAAQLEGAECHHQKIAVSSHVSYIKQVFCICIYL